MLRLKFILILILMICVKSHSQIINVESLRKVADTTKWSGSVSLNVGLIKNKNNVFKIINRAHIQYSNEKNILLFVNDLNFQKLESDEFINKGIQHLRYNYKFRPKITWELFLQTQYDAVSNINFRGLVGTGPRFKLGTSEKYKFYLGALAMYEYEKTSDNVNNINRDLRASMYLSFSLYPSNHISIISTTYYQPKFNQFSDFRVSNETSVAFKIFKDLAFKSTFTLLFDAFPANNIPTTQYELTNGLVYSFN